jgi:hypothetical protein
MASVTSARSKKFRRRRAILKPLPLRPQLSEPHPLCLLMRRGAYRGKRIGGDFPPLLADSFLDRGFHGLGHLHHVPYKCVPLIGIGRQLTGRFDFRIERRLLSASSWNVRPRRWNRRIVRITKFLTHELIHSFRSHQDQEQEPGRRGGSYLSIISQGGEGRTIRSPGVLFDRLSLHQALLNSKRPSGRSVLNR